MRTSFYIISTCDSSIAIFSVKTFKHREIYNIANESEGKIVRACGKKCRTVYSIRLIIKRRCKRDQEGPFRRPIHELRIAPSIVRNRENIYVSAVERYIDSS